MTGGRRFFIEPQWEPRGEGNGWDLAPDDSTAAVFCVVEVCPVTGEERIDHVETSRRAAESVIARLTAARRLDDEARANAPPVPPPKVKTPLAASLVIWAACIVIIWAAAALVKAAS